MPVATDLPSELIPMARRQAHEITDKRWNFDCEELMKIVEGASGKPRKVNPATASKDHADINVANELIVTDKSRIGNIKGAVGAIPADKTIEVASKAKIEKGSQTGDIIGIEFSSNTRDKKA